MGNLLLIVFAFITLFLTNFLLVFVPTPLKTGAVSENKKIKIRFSVIKIFVTVSKGIWSHCSGCQITGGIAVILFIKIFFFHMIFVSNCRVGLVRVRAGTRLNTNLPCRKSPWRVAAPRRWGSWHLWVESILVFRWWILRRNWTHPRALSAKPDQNISKHTVGISIKNTELKVVAH